MIQDVCSKTGRPEGNETRRGLCSRSKLQSVVYSRMTEAEVLNVMKSMVPGKRKARCSAINKERPRVERQKGRDAFLGWLGDQRAGSMAAAWASTSSRGRQERQKAANGGVVVECEEAAAKTQSQSQLNLSPSTLLSDYHSREKRMEATRQREEKRRAV